MADPHPIETAQAQWHITLRHTTGDEWVGPCPFCKDGNDRFHVWERGNYWCRVCEQKGFIDGEGNHPLTPQELLEIRVRALERKQAEHERRLTALEQMARCRDHIAFHELMDDDDREYWHSQGLLDATIDKYLLGICYSCPLAPKFSSYTIPVINGGKLVNIRHRLVTTDSDRYRPHAPGLGATLFLADNVYQEEPQVMIVEGEKKALVTSQYGFNVVGTMGKAGFQPGWAPRFSKFERVLVAYDPDATEQAIETARLFKGRGRVVEIPVKVDDLFTQYHGTPAQLQRFIELARRVD